MKEFILCAAIHYDDGRVYENQPDNIRSGFIVSGRRHKDCHNLLTLMKEKFNSQHDNTLCEREHQGFITSANRYVGRAEAFQIAKANNQIYHKMFDGIDEGSLTSEDLYPDED